MKMSPKTFVFLAGLPRSGSTLISTVLNQNPNIHSGPNSPVLNLIQMVESFRCHETNVAFSYDKELDNVEHSLLNEFYSNYVEMVCVDKNRGWTDHVAFLKRHIHPNPKIICPVRSIHSILNSFLNLIDREQHEVDNFMDRPFDVPEEIARCTQLLNNGVLGSSIQSLLAALETHPQHLFLCDYETMVSNPRETFQNMYKFLELPYFEHNFTNLFNPFETNDMAAYGISNMHSVRPEVGLRALNERVPACILEECKTNPVLQRLERIRERHAFSTYSTSVVCKSGFGEPGT